VKRALKARPPAVSGIFYPNDASQLEKIVEQSFIDKRFGPGKLPPATTENRIYGIVSPHAGYIYSGSIAANGFYYSSNMDFNTVIITGPNHYGIGSGVATMLDSLWKTPLGDTEVNTHLADQIAKNSSVIDVDDFAHSRDHCLEVQLPFLQYSRKNKQFKIVPIILMLQDIKTARDIGNAIAKSTIDNNKTFLIASSDFTHYEPNSEAHRKDSELINAILSLDIISFYSVLERLNVSACGYGAIASIMTAVKALGAKKGELLRYATSGDVTGDTSSVVGYSSIAFV
jgi:AmmeMemoRadiSam system protein B